MTRIMLAAGFAAAGLALLIGLGLWQVQRLGWKQAILADIAARIVAAPVALPADPDPVAHRYLPVAATGRVTGAALRVLISLPQTGAGYRIIAPFDIGAPSPLATLGAVRQPAGDLRRAMIAPLDGAGPSDAGAASGPGRAGAANVGTTISNEADAGGGSGAARMGSAVPITADIGADPSPDGGRRIMIDLGYVPVADAYRIPSQPIAVTGNLHWPDEVDGFTPDADVAGNIWFARDVPAMAAALGTAPVLLVARTVTPDAGTVPLPVTTAGIPNDHLNYAITWFALGAIWTVMATVLLLRMIRARREA